MLRLILKSIQEPDISGLQFIRGRVYFAPFLAGWDDFSGFASAADRLLSGSEGLGPKLI
jgi:hypothetical protein